jgi:hypothetical protein
MRYTIYSEKIRERLRFENNAHFGYYNTKAFWQFRSSLFNEYTIDYAIKNMVEGSEEDGDDA